MRNKDIDDSILAARMCGGDVYAYELLFKKWWHTVLNFAMAIVQNETDADDIAQTVFMKLWKDRATIRIPSMLPSWLMSCTRNEALDCLRRRKTRRATEVTGEGDERENLSIQDLSDYLSTSSALSKALDKMPEQRRKIFMLSRYESLSNKDIASMLNLSVRTVETHLHLALKDIRKNLN